MNKHTFIYTDAKSNKFWSIELSADATSYTVVYGKVGTTGQTAKKDFSSTDACRKAADKLIAEKTGKGYVEQTAKGTPVAPDKSKTPTSTKGTASGKVLPFNDDSYKQLSVAIPPKQAAKQYSLGGIQYDFASMAKEDEGQETRLVKGNLHIAQLDSAKASDWNLYNLIIDGDLLIDGDLDWAENSNGSFIYITGNLKARNLIIQGNPEIYIEGNVDLSGGILCHGGDDGGRLTIHGTTKARFVISTTYFNPTFSNKPEAILITDDEESLGYTADYQVSIYGEDEDEENLRSFDYIIDKKYLDKEGSINESKLTAALREGKEILITAANTAAPTDIATAASMKQWDLVRKLALAGADVNQKGKKGGTALKYAIRCPESGDIVQLLIEKGAKCDGKNDSSPLYTAVEKNHLAAIAALIKAKVNLDPVNEYKRTALAEACFQNFPKAALLLVEAGADLNKKDEYDQTAFQLAAENGCIEMVRYGLAKGCPLNDQTSDGSTAIQWAAENGHLEIVKLLLEAGADPKIKNDNGIDALKFAKENDHDDIVAYLKSKKK